MKRNIALGFAVLISALAFMLVEGSPRAAAISGPCWFNTVQGPVTGTGTCSVPGFGDYGTHDVLTGRNPDGSGKAIPDSVNTKQELIDFVIGKYNNGNAQDRVGSAFIIQTLRGSRAWPVAANVDNWVKRMQNPDVTVTRASVGIFRTSWYDPGKHNTFYANYSPGNRESLVVRYRGAVHAVIETGCGNLANNQVPLPNYSWGAMNAVSEANKATVSPGGSVTWTHEVWNTGSVGTGQTPEISGDVYWGGGTTGPIPTTDRVGTGNPPLEVQPDKSYSRRFDRGRANGATRQYTFTVPASAQNGDTYCQFINGSATSSNDPGNFRSASAACVTVQDTGGGTVDCSTISVPASVSPSSAQITISATGTSSTLPVTATLNLTDPIGAVTTRTTPATGTASALSVTFVVPRPATGFMEGVYTARVTFAATAGSDTCLRSFRVQSAPELPYMSVYGGDVRAVGRYMSASGSTIGCQDTDSEAVIETYNQGSGSFLGGGTNIAAFAQGPIDQFASGRGGSATSAAPKGLTFANNSASNPYGGDFNDSTFLCDEMASTLQSYISGGTARKLGADNTTLTISSAAPLSGAASGVYYHIGDIYINGNINLGDTWGNIAAIPNVNLVAVGGNIYIDYRVTRIDGHYIAIDDNSAAVEGRIVTCVVQPKPTISSTEVADVCGDFQLVINGSFTARLISFYRVKGSLAAATNAELNLPASGVPSANIAEVFKYDPTNWLPRSFRLSDTYDAIVGLPPLL